MSTIATPRDDRAPALQARPSEIIDVGAAYRGSVAPGEVIYARRYADATLYDAMRARGQLSDRQHAAAERIAGLWVAAGLAACPQSRYGEATGGYEHDPVGEDLIDPRVAYRTLLRGLAATQAWAIDSLMHGDHPGRCLGALQSGLDALADEWKLSS